MRVTTVSAGVALLGATLALPAAAQRQTIEIRGQVPTPQIVTVRPREVPAFSTQVLVPAFYDHQFWPVILPAYQIVNRSDVYGVMATDSMPSVAGVPVAGAPAVVPAAPPVSAAAARDSTAAIDTAAAPATVVRPAVPPATESEEIQALRRELEARRVRLDSIEAIRKRQLDSLERAVRERQREQRARVDSTVRPPGTPPAP